MADRFPLILNTNANQIQEIASGDTLDLTNNNISNAGVITATSFSGPVVAGAGVSNVTAGIGTYTDLRVGGNTTFSEDFVVTGNARVTGILTVGTSSIILNDSTDTIKVGTALTLGHTQGLQFHTQNLHSAGFDVNQINASGIITATTFKGDGDFVELDVDGHTNLDNVSVAGVSTFTGAIDANGDLDVDGHTNLDNLNVAGVSTFAGAVTTGDHVTLSGQNPRITFTDSNHNPDYELYGSAGNFKIWDSTNNVGRLVVNSDGHVDIPGNLDCEAGIDVTGNATVSGNLSVGGVLTYEDVTNVDSVGIVTARQGVRLGVDGTSSSNYISVGASNDLKIWHQSSNNHSYIREDGSGSLIVLADDFYVQDTSTNTMISAKEGAEVNLHFNGGTPKLSTTNTGVTITGNIAVSGTVDGVDIAALNTTVGNISTDLVNDSSPQLGGDLDVNSNKIKGGHTIYEIVANTRHKFDCNGSTIMNINAGGVDFSVGHNTHSDNVENRHGTHNDIRIYHSGSHSYIKNTTDYTLWIQNEDSQSVIVSNNSGANKSASFNIGAAAELYYANDKKFETTSSGTHHSGFTHTFGASGAIPTLKAGGSNTDIALEAVGAGGWVELKTTGTARWRVKGTDGHFYPVVNNTYDIGTSSERVRNIYTNDLNLSNKGGANDVDNTWGDYTIQEGESDLFLINNRSGKKYKFNLTEVS